MYPMNTDRDKYINDNVQAIVELLRDAEECERCSSDWFQLIFRSGSAMQNVLDASGVDTLEQVLRKTSSIIGAENIVIHSKIQKALDDSEKPKRGRHISPCRLTQCIEIVRHGFKIEGFFVCSLYDSSQFIKI